MAHSRTAAPDRSPRARRATRLPIKATALADTALLAARTHGVARPAIAQNPPRTARKRVAAPKITETAEHRTIASWVRKLGPGGTAVMFHLRGERHGYNQRAVAARMGVLSSLPDWCIVDGGRVGFIELKQRGWRKRTAKTGTFTTHELKQLSMQDRLRRAGAWVEICETLDEVQDALVRYGVPLRNESETLERLKRVFAEAL